MNTLLIASHLGEFSILLHGDQAPRTCEYFADLVARGAFDNSSVFRIVAENNHRPDEPYPIHVVQIGPIQKLSSDKHPISHEGTNLTGLKHRKWTVSAARFDLGELYGSFFICMRDEPELDFGGGRQPDGQGFAAFGEVIEGFKAVEQLYQRAGPDEILSKPIPISGITLVRTN